MNGHATINRFYRLIWSEKQGAWVAVAENVRGRGKSSGRGAFMAALFAGLGLAPFAWAGPPGANQLPTGGQVVGGAATITQSGSQMTINQATQRGAIDWQTFNLGSQAQVNFQQPNSGSVTLNRVQDSQASQIFGRITANGQVFLSNPNGVYFSPTSSVNVGGLVATTHGIGTAEFMAGSNTFERNGATGSVVNDGSLNASLGGYIALLAPQVRNNGVVIAQAGTVAMAAGEQISLQFADSRTLAGVLVSPSTIAALVENGSAVQAPGGMIIMSAQAANDLQGGVVRNTGGVAATGLSSRGGKIVLDSAGLVDNSGSLDASGTPGGKGSVTISGDRMASSGAVRADGGGTITSSLAHGLVETTSAVLSAQGGGNITVDGGAGKVYTSGSYSADGEQGGKVVITANEVALMGAKVSATGASKGGTILIGGDYQGKNAGVHNAAKTSVGAGVTLNADATGNGNGGKVVVWSDEKTVFAGELTARGGAAGGDGGILEVSGKETLYFGGKADAHAAKGKSGSLLLDPKDIYIDSELSGQLELVDPHPTVGGSFGKLNAPLTTTSGSTVTRTGYIVVTNPNDNLGATDSGAAYLFRQSDQALISTLYGTHAGDKVGSNGVTSLTNGNYVVSSNLWNGGKGAVTWGNGTTGWGAGAVAVSSSNSLVGNNGTHKSTMNEDTSDNIGGYAITVLKNGNYLVGTPSFNNNRGALTFGNGSTGVVGIVSAANSLVGSTAMTIVPADGYKQYKYGDQVGSSVTVLANDNYVMANANWNKGVGAVTFASGTTGIKGVVGSANSLIGDSTRFDSTGSGTGTDKVGKYLTVLTGSQFIVYGSDWKNSSGALTSFDGVTPITGLVSASNSLVGSAGDNLSSGGLTVLPSNNAFVISSPGWNGGRGAATWVPFSTDVKTVTVASNGVVGANAGDSVGSKAIALLANNDYVVISPNWSSGKGAATLVDGSTGKAKADQSGDVSATTSLVGTQANDVVGSGGIMELKGNGNYVVLSPYWANGGNTKAGAVTWSSGGTPTVGAVGTGNSLVGSSANDRIGSYQYNYYQANNSNAFLSESSSVTLLSNGNYVVASPMFNGTRGAVTWSSGATGATADAGHTITASNSLLGSNTGDFIGGFMGPNDVITNAANQTVTHYDTISNGVTALSNGNYVTVSNYWRNGSALRAGAVTWSDGAGAPTVGLVSAGNSLVGSVQDDMVGLAQNNTYGIKLLENGYDSASNTTYSGNYVVTSNKWNNGSIVDAGAVTWGSGTAALTGAISDGNSVLGLKTDDVKNWSVSALPANGNYLIQNQYWDNGAAIGAGALTWVDGSSGRLADYAAQGNHNIVSGANSLVGSHTGDNVGGTVDFLYNYDAVNSRQRFTGNYVALSYNWTNDTKQYAGAVTWGNGATGVKGVISRSNSLIGEKENDALGAYYVALMNGNYVVANPTLDVGGVVNAGAVSWVDGSTGRLNDYAAQGNQNIMSGANALVGSHTNDYVGGLLSLASNYALNSADYTNNGYFISSPDWNCSAGAVNYISDASVPLIGVVGAGNAAVGNPNGRFWGGLTYNPNISLTSGGAAMATFTGDNGHVVLLTPTMPAPGAMTLPGATQFGDAEGATQAMTPDYIAGVLKTGTSVTLQANNDIFVKNGIDATGGTAGGALTMQAGRSITVLGDIITGNRDLNLVANDSVANGVKDAYRDAGIATLSMGSNKQGVAAKIDAGSGDVSLLIAAGADKTNNMAGSISVNSITARTIKLVNQGNGAGTVGDLPNLAANCCGFDLGYRGIGADVTLNAGAVLSASGAGTAVTLAAKGNFNNNSGNGAGSIAMSDPAARWLVYANAPGGSTYGGLDSQNTAIWNASYNGSDPVQSGNRYLFAYQPTITVGTQNVSKTYGDDLSTGTTLVDRVVSLSGGQAAQAGAYLADTVSTALSGNITATSSGAAANAGVAGGPYAITVNLSGATGNNGYAVALGSNTARTITVAAKALTAGLSGVTKTYDGGTTANLGAANYSLTGLVGSDAFNVTKSTGVYNLSGTGASSASTTLAGGDFSAANGTAASNYILPTSASGAASITPKTLTAALTGVTKTYDGSASAALSGANYQLSGFVGAESATVSQAAGQYNSANVVGASSVSASLAVPDFTAGASTSLANYVLPTTATGAATITPKALTASLTGAIVKTYDGGLTAVLNPGNYSLNGFIAGESGGITQTAGLYNSANVSGATTVTANLSSSDLVAGASTLASNYSLPASASGAASITARTLSATLTGVSKVYDGGTAAALTGANYQLTGLVGGESASVSQTAGLYNSAEVLGANSVSASLSGANFTAGGSTSLANYSLPTVATGSAAITPKALAASLTGTISKTYDGSSSALLGAGNFALSGFVGAQSAGVTHTSGIYNAASVAGASSVTASLASGDFSAGAGTTLSNYSLPVSASGGASITAKALTASLSGVSKVYDGGAAAALNGANYQLAGLVGGESASVSQTVGLYNSAEVLGANSVSASLSGANFTAGAGTSLANYSLPAVATGSAAITPKTLTASLSGMSKVYDGGTAAVLNGANYQLTGLVSGQSASVSQTAGLYNSAEVLGANSVSASLSGANFTAGAGTSLANYSLPAVATGSAAITPKALAASLTGTISKTYDGSSSALLGAGNFSLSGFVGAQSAGVTQTSGVYNAASVAGASSVTASLASGDFTASAGTTLSNYSLPVSASGGASITARALTASLTGALGRSYNGTATASLAGSNFSLAGVVGGETINIGAVSGSYDSRNAGTRTVSATLAAGDFTAGAGTVLGNYVLPTLAAGSAVITPKAIVLNAPAISKVYDGTLAYTASAGDLSTLSGALVQGDTVSSATFSYADKNAGSGNKAVNLTQAAISDGNGGANYSVSLAGNSNSTITPRVLNASATGANRVYDTSTSASVSLNDDRIAGDTLTLSNASASFADKNAGSNKVVTVSGIAAAGADAGNYTLASSTATTTASITPATLQVTGVSAQGRSYDTSLNAALAGTAVVTALGSDIVKVTGTGIGQFLDKNAGNNKAITVSGYASSDSNYVLAQPTGLSATVTPAVLALSGLTPGVSKTYDGTTRVTITGAPTVSGFGNEVVTVGGVGAGQFADKNAGTGKTITVSGLTASDSNYVIGQQAGLTGTIAPAQLSLGPVTASTRSYDGTSAAQIDAASYRFTGLVNGESVTVSKTAGTFDSRNAGNRTLSIGLAAGDYTAGSGTVLANYLLPTLASGSGVITPKAIVLNAPAISKVYDGTLAYTASAGDLSTLSGALVQGDTVSGATFSYADKNAGNGNKAVNLTQAAISDGNGGANYSVSLAGNSNSTITPRVLNASATGANRVYDTSTSASVSLNDDRIAGDTLTLSNTSASFADKNAGSNKVITVSGIAAGGADAGNYTLASSTATTTASITPATLQVTGVAAQGRAYDTSLTAGLTGTAVVTALGSDIVKVTGTGIGQFLDKNAGNNKAISVTGYASSDSNYVLAQPTGLSATVTPAVLALSGLTPGVSKTYDGTTGVTITGAPTVSGFGNEVVTVGGVGAGQFADKNAGTGKTITVSGLTASDSNYVIGQQAGLTGTIAPAQLSLGPVTASTRSYDGTSAAQIDAASYRFTGLVNGESVTVSKTAGTFDSRNAGNRTLSIGLAAGDYTAGSGTVLANYLLPTLASGSGVITPKTVVLNAPSISKVYDGTVAYTATAGDLSSLSAALVQGDTVSGATFSYADKNAGSGNKAVNLTQAAISDGNGGANYSVSLAGNSNSTITPRVLNASATGANRVYDTSTSASVSLNDDRIAGDTLTLSNASASFADKNAGSNKVVTVSGIAAAGADAGNYTLASSTATTTASITPATLQVTGVSVQQRSYDRSLNAVLGGAPTVTALGTDVVSVVGTGSGSYADKNAGTGKAVTVTGYSSSDSNYVLLQPAGLTGTVTPAVLQVSGLSLAAAKTYDGTRNVALSGTATVKGIDGEVVTVGGNGGGQFADKNAGTGKAITLVGYTASDSNYAIGQEPGLVGSITPAPITVAGVRANSKTFDGNATATLNGTPAINVIGADDVTLGGTASASFADATAGAAKPVTVSGYALAGTDAANYALRQPQGLSADIADAAVQIPPPVVVTPPALPALPQAEQRVAPGLSMPPLSDVPGTGTGLSSTAPAEKPAATPAPAPASITPVAQASTAGITVSLVRPPSLQQGGAIAVSVPKQIVDAGTGFGFPLPAQVVEAAAVNRVPVQAQLADGSALPSWISYNADSKSFVVTQVPNGALPVEIVLVIGGQRATMVVAER